MHHFRDNSIKSITCTGTVIQAQYKCTTVQLERTPNTNKLDL